MDRRSGVYYHIGIWWVLRYMRISGFLFNISYKYYWNVYDVLVSDIWYKYYGLFIWDIRYTWYRDYFDYIIVKYGCVLKVMFIHYILGSNPMYISVGFPTWYHEIILCICFVCCGWKPYVSHQVSQPDPLSLIPSQVV